MMMTRERLLELALRNTRMGHKAPTNRRAPKVWYAEPLAPGSVFIKIHAGAQKIIGRELRRLEKAS